MATHDAEADPRNERIRIWIDGALKRKSEAMVSVYDSGFLMGDGVWEGLRLYDGRWAFLEDHLDRLYEAARAIDLDIGLTRAEITAALEETRIANDMTTDAHARLMVTRGRKSKPFQHPKFSVHGATVVVILEHSRPAEALAKGIRLVTVPQIRGLPMTQDPKLNSHSKLNCILACIQAAEAGADEALMLDAAGAVATCNSTHFFIVRKGEVWTSDGLYCLGGITRANVIRIAGAAGLAMHEKRFSLVDVYGADEAFVTGTFAGLVPVDRVDGRTIGTAPGDGDRAGPVTRRLRTLYKDLARAEAVRPS